MGLGTASRVRAITEAPQPTFQDLEFFFGRIDPGATRTYTTQVQVPKDAHSCYWTVRFRFAEEYGHQPPDATLRLRVRGRQRPLFSAQYHLIDDVRGNGDGLAQSGESVRLRVVVRNLGAGTSADTVATLKPVQSPGVFLHRGRGRLTLGRLAPGEEQSGEFVFDLRPGSDTRAVKLELTLVDQEIQEGVRDQLTVPIQAGARSPTSLSGAVTVRRDRAPLHGGADERSPVLFVAPRGATFRLTGQAGGFYRLQLPSGLPGFLSVADTERTGTVPPGTPPVLVRQFHLTPPLIQVGPYPLRTTEEVVTLTADVVDDTQVQDAHIEVTNPRAKVIRQKQYYQSNRKGQSPRALRLSAPVRLAPGLNFVTFVARESAQVRSEQVIVILREPGPRRPVALGSAVR
jgi:carboxyl-terminal processing protease